MIIGIDMGHKENTGAYMETYYNRLVGNRLIQMLKEKGHQPINCTSENSNVNSQLVEIVQKANNQKLDLLVSLHCNAFNGTAEGVEVFIAPKTYYANTTSYEKDKSLAQTTVNTISTYCNYKNRGVKEDTFYVLVNALSRSIYIEMFFSDNENERNKFNLDKMCNAIYKSITGTEYINNICPTCGK